MRSVPDRLRLIGDLPVVDVSTGETVKVAEACAAELGGSSK